MPDNEVNAPSIDYLAMADVHPCNNVWSLEGEKFWISECGKGDMSPSQIYNEIKPARLRKRIALINFTFYKIITNKILVGSTDVGLTVCPDHFYCCLTWYWADVSCFVVQSLILQTNDAITSLRWTNLRALPISMEFSMEEHSFVGTLVTFPMIIFSAP